MLPGAESRSNVLSVPWDFQPTKRMKTPSWIWSAGALAGGRSWLLQGRVRNVLRAQPRAAALLELRSQSRELGSYWLAASSVGAWARQSFIQIQPGSGTSAAKAETSAPMTVSYGH